MCRVHVPGDSQHVLGGVEPRHLDAPGAQTLCHASRADGDVKDVLQRSAASFESGKGTTKKQPFHGIHRLAPRVPEPLGLVAPGLIV
jgi:hypothetical protein